MKRMRLLLTLLLVTALMVPAASASTRHDHSQKETITAEWATEEVREAQALDLLCDGLPTDYRTHITRGDFCRMMLSYLAAQWNIDPDTLEQLGIRPEWLTRRALEVSGGQLQRISIARALDPRTRYLVADEITTMMDGLLQADIWAKLVAAVRERDLGMLVVSHDRDLMRHVCDEVIEFDGGAGTRR